MSSTTIDERVEAASPRPPASGSLGLWDAVSIIVGVVIGAGIYETVPLVLSNVTSPAQALGVWVAGGALSLIGATCYAELASTYPRSGGDYVYLSRTFGPLVGFLFGWAQLAVILTSSIGMMAYVFADYASALWNIHGTPVAFVAALPVIALSVLNIAGVVVGKAVQNLLSVAKVVGLGCIVIAGFWLGSVSAPAPAPMPSTAAGGGASLGLAMILVLYTFGGWNDAAFVAAEVRDRRRNMPRALLYGTAIVTVVYLLVNAAFIAGLGFERARGSKAIAAELFEAALGPGAGAAISILVMISALGAANALVFTGARVYAAVGEDHGALAWLRRKTLRSGAPVAALVAQLVITIAMILTVGTELGRRAIDAALGAAGVAGIAWSGHGGFDTLLRATAPVFWLFFLMTGLSLFVSRRIDRARPRPFRVPLYPLFPLLFCATAAYMLIAAVRYAGMLTALAALPVLAGIPLYFASKRRPRSAES